MPDSVFFGAWMPDIGIGLAFLCTAFVGRNAVEFISVLALRVAANNTPKSGETRPESLLVVFWFVACSPWGVF